MNIELKKALLKKHPLLEDIQEDGLDIIATFRFKEYGEMVKFLERVDLKHYASMCTLITKKNEEIATLKSSQNKQS